MASQNHVESKESSAEHFELDKKDAADDVHIRNEYAYKGDDSDGKVAWTLRHSVAAISLGMLYAG
jgi:hypothetical protein